MKKGAQFSIRRLLPRWLRRGLLRLTRRPPVGRVDLGDLRRLKPISRAWGGDRGQPVDRYYIEKFLQTHAEDVRGRVLEIGDNVYTRRFGGQRVKESQVLDVFPNNPKATIVADLTSAPHVPSNSFDCIVCLQTLHLIPDLRAALATLHRVLDAQGVLLATAPAVSRLDDSGDSLSGDFWRVTTNSALWLVGEFFDREQISITAHGNVLAAVAFLHGISSEELTREELDYRDPRYEMLVTVRAVKKELTPDSPPLD